MIGLYKPTIKRKDMDSVLSTLVDECAGPGQKSIEFSSSMATLLGYDYGVAFRSYVRTLFLACHVLQIEHDDKVIISAAAPAIFVTVLNKLGCEILLADVEENSTAISIASVLELEKMQPKAILIEETFGNIPDYEAVAETKIPIIRDITANIYKKDLGPLFNTIQHIAIIQTEDNCLVSTGGGGMLFLQDKKMQKEIELELLAYQGFETMPDMNAALGISQLQQLSSTVEKRVEICNLFSKGIAKTRHKRLIEGPIDTGTPAVCFPILLESSMKSIQKYTAKYKIEIQNPFEDCAGVRLKVEMKAFPNAYNLYLRTVIFPLYPMLSNDQLKIIVKVLSTLP